MFVKLLLKFKHENRIQITGFRGFNVPLSAKFYEVQCLACTEFKVRLKISCNHNTITKLLNYYVLNYQLNARLFLF